MISKEDAIRTAKEFRKRADDLLQDMKRHRTELLVSPDISKHDHGETIAQHVLSTRDLESSIMRQGMVLKNIGADNPYPQSYNPDSPVVEPTADGLKL